MMTSSGARQVGIEKRNRIARLRSLVGRSRSSNGSRGSTSAGSGFFGVDTEGSGFSRAESVVSDSAAVQSSSNDASGGTRATSGTSTDSSYFPAGLMSEGLVAGIRRGTEIEKYVSQHVKIRFESKIEDVYEFGNDVVPGENKSASQRRRRRTGVIYAKNRTTGEIVVLKFRHKNAGSATGDISNWLSMMKFWHYVSIAKKTKSYDTTTSTPLNSPPFSTDHLCAILDLCEDDEYYYVIMEWVRGRDMFDYIRQEKPHLARQNERDTLARNFCHELVVALRELRDLGLTHRDIKLENIVVVEDNEQALACNDYGFEYSGNKSESFARTGPLLKIVDFDTLQLYKPGRRGYHVMGTDQYIAPESYAGFPSPASDMWSAGVVIYTMLTARFPFHHGVFDDEKGQNYVGHEKMAAVRKRLQHTKINWRASGIWKSIPEAYTLVRACFEFKGEDRLTVRQALRHPWIVNRSPLLSDEIQ